MPGKSQASELDYDLKSLGWKSFQDLCATIVSVILGQTAQLFHSSRDGGRDGAFNGQWRNDNGEILDGSFTVQCKFSSKDASLTLASLADEIIKAERLGRKGLANNYLLMTNLSISGVATEVIEQKFQSLEGINKCLVYGKEWITLKIRESPELRMYVPRVYGLGDLSQILDERAYHQANDILSALGEDLSKIVITKAYKQAAHALANHGFVLLLGEPAAGKSTIAASLAVGALDRWRCSTLKLRDASEFVKHWNPVEPSQFFWIDDAFGTTQYQSELTNEWNQTWPHMNAAIRKGSKILLTSRDYIYRAAKYDLKQLSFPLLHESQVIIEVQRLSKKEKEQILYNHIKLGKQKYVFRTQIKRFLGSIAHNRHFLPEIARRLGNPLFTKKLFIDEPSLRNFVEKPIDFLTETVMNLDAESRAALALVFMRGGSLESPVELTKKEKSALDILGVTLPAARQTLNVLDGSLLLLFRSEDKATWKFKHPTIGDAYASIVASDPELLDIYMAWTSAEKLITEVTCGNVGLKGVKVIVPKNRFDKFLDRLRELKPNRSLFSFLASRCSSAFLKLYLERHKEIADFICRPNSYLSTATEIDLLVRLDDLKLLPSSWRQSFVQHVKDLVLKTPDVDFLSDRRIRNLLLPEEVAILLELTKNKLIPKLSFFVENLKDNYTPDLDADAFFDPLLEVVNTLLLEFKDDVHAVSRLNVLKNEIEDAIEGHRDWLHEYEPDYEFTDTEDSDRQQEERSIFDDIDE